MVDTSNTLTHAIRTLQMDKRKVSTLFLDINGGFDNVNPASLWGRMSAKGVNPYLGSQTCSFLWGRSRHPLLQNSPKVFAPALVGTPQSSPLSPRLFVIYWSRLDLEIPYGLTLSYIDDFSLSVSSTSYCTTIRLLQKQYTRIKPRGSRLGLGSRSLKRN